MKKKVIILVLAAMLVLGCAMGATLAWLTSSATVTNTFTPSDINITLTEENPAVDADGNHIAKMVPGIEITKDPKVTVETGSEKCFLFIEISGDDVNNKKFIAWDIADGWTALDGVANVYYRIVDETEQGTPFSILKNDKVTVSDTLSKADMTALKNGAGKIDMTFTAYAVQYENIATNGGDMTDAKNAWAKRVTH